MENYNLESLERYFGHFDGVLVFLKHYWGLLGFSYYDIVLHIFYILQQATRACEPHTGGRLRDLKQASW